MGELSGGPGTRQPQLKSLEAALKRRVIAFFTSFAKESGAIGHPDVDMFVDLLAAGDSRPLTLILSSPGGSALAAERIVHACRDASNGDFEVLVPGQAKSAATILSMGAKKILMTPTAELGPIDPQVYEKAKGWIPAHTIIRSYEYLLKAAVSSKGRIEPYLQQLDRFDASLVEQLKDEVALSDKVARKLLTSGMLRGKKKQAVNACLAYYLKPELTGSHSRAIFPGDAAKSGLKIETVSRDNPIFQNLWEYYWRASSFTIRAGKLIESDEHSFHVA